MKEFFQKCWKTLAMIPVVVTMIGGIAVLPSYVATPADLKSLETRVMDKIELDRDLQKLNNVNENLYRVKAQRRQYPKDKEIQEDYESLVKEKTKLQRAIEKR